MDLHLESKNVNELKLILKKYDLVNGYSQLKRDDLIQTIRAVKKYKDNKQLDYKTYRFGDKIINLNDEQHKIVIADIKQNIRIVSCAGSGKTTTIICRIKYLIDQGVDPERIMITAFNVDAAESIKKRLIELFGFLPKLTVGTIDSIACRYYYRYFRQPYHVGVSEYATYLLKYLQSEGNIISSIYQYIFFDEFQDVNEIQFQILQTFYNYGAYITVIGDDSQCIYAFRGSNIKYILNLEKHFKNLKTYKLVNNYRSTPEIINFANESIKLNTEQLPKDMVANIPSINFMPTVKYFNNIYIQNDHIIKTILEYNEEKDISLDEIAILCRVNYPLKLFEEAIEKFNKKNDNKLKYVALINDDGDTKPKIKPNHITLTTIHKSKGLEWKIVFLIDCADSRFPSEIDKLSIQEERRLFYVAVTRAKQYLYLFFNGEKNGDIIKINKLTRFVQELNRDKYQFDNYDSKYYHYEDYRGAKWISGVTETLKLLNEYDISKLRDLEIIPKTNPIITKIHDKYEFNNYINTYYLQPDFGEFIDRYITRNIGKRNNESKGLIDIPTVIIISACQFTNEELQIYKKYETNFKINMKKLNLDIQDIKYIAILNENSLNLAFIKKIEMPDRYVIKSIVQKMLLTAHKYNIDINVLANCFCVKNEVSDKIKKKLTESYKRYNSNDYQSNEINYDIYNISLCGTILNGRRRLLYKDVYDNFHNGYENMFNDIGKYVNTLNPEFTNLICKKMIITEEYDLIGEMDLLDIDHCKIIDFKCSSSDKFKLDWLLQLLAYVSIIKKNYDQITIKEIEIYNPLQGEIYTIDISEWNKADEFLSYLYEIRIRQITRNIKVEDKEIEANYPIVYDTDDQDVHPHSKILNDIQDINIYDLQKIFGDDYRYYLDELIKGKNKFKNYEMLIDKLEYHNNKKYLVIDTETTGLPERPSVGSYYSYEDLNKYKDARMIQVCWAIYDGDKLETLEDHIIKPVGFEINNSEIHGITHKKALITGHNLNTVLAQLSQDIAKVKYIVGHNISFDMHILCSELYRSKFYDVIDLLKKKELICTMEKSIPLKVDGILKPSKLIKVYKFLFNKEFENQHNAKYDVLATADIFRELIKRQLIFI